ncbi:MAG TPA: hypothetical protein ENN79_07115 [Desulfobacteraceae bacterium]|nr:hypothetical protein [Desulfobacteraceae bacterium]
MNPFIQKLAIAGSVFIIVFSAGWSQEFDYSAYTQTTLQDVITEEQNHSLVYAEAGKCADCIQLECTVLKYRVSCRYSHIRRPISEKKKIKIVTTRDFLEITPDGVINFITSKQLLIDIAKAEHPPADYDLLIDCRDTKWQMSTTDVYELASELCRHGDTFHRKVAILVSSGVNFNSATFLETCSHNRGFSVDAFTDFEATMRWFLSMEDLLKDDVLPNADTGEGNNRI